MKTPTESLSEIKSIIKTHTEKLNAMKANRAYWEEEKWTDAQLNECNAMINVLASILSDLNIALTATEEVEDIEPVVYVYKDNSKFKVLNQHNAGLHGESLLKEGYKLTSSVCVTRFLEELLNNVPPSEYSKAIQSLSKY